MAKKQPDTNIPQHEIEALARCLLPEIQKFFESPEGQKEFEEWKAQRAKETEKKYPIPAAFAAYARYMDIVLGQEKYEERQ